MKRLVLLILTLGSIKALAAESYVCDNNLGHVTTLTLSSTYAIFDDVEYKNLLAIDSSVPFRFYTHIGNPWREVEIPLAMLDHKDGVITYTEHSIETNEYLAVDYVCTR